ncbi:MAG: hypothetical protein ACJ74O_18695 [Frankiaceae bacterium]
MTNARTAATHDFVMRRGWRALLTWFPIAWLVAVMIALISAGGTAFLLWAFFLAYGVAFVVLSRFQVLTVRVRDEGLIEFVSPARVTPIYFDDLVEVAPAPGPFQRRFATRFKSHHKRITVLSGMYGNFDALVAEVERRTHARIVRY